VLLWPVVFIDRRIRAPQSDVEASGGAPQATNLMNRRAGKLWVPRSEYVERVILEAEKWEHLRELMIHTNSSRGGYPTLG
jgi:hypothetical protein